MGVGFFSICMCVCVCAIVIFELCTASNNKDNVTLKYRLLSFGIAAIANDDIVSGCLILIMVEYRREVARDMQSHVLV